MKNIKEKAEVNVKLSLPKNFQWKILRQLKRDLGFEGLEGSQNEFLDDLSGFTENREIDIAIRNRSGAKLKKATESFSPQCMTECDSSKYSVFARYQLGAFLKKYPEKGTDSRRAALEKFSKTENICRLFNQENYRGLLAMDSSHPDYLGVVEEIRSDILSLLGESPNIFSVIGHAKHGPGTSFLRDLYTKGETTEYFKWSKLPYTVTKECVPYAKTAILSDPRWIGALDNAYRTRFRVPIGAPIDMDLFWSYVIEEVQGSRITTVPKSAEIDRTIAIEPLLNVYLQLGVDHVMKCRLKKRWHYDLQNQELNQRLAHEASQTNQFATVDLASASDTITLKICELLLPAAWYDLLLDLRARETLLDGQWLTLEKISSMGNGFTFALETVIFGALTRCAIRRTKSERRSAVYGDDIVIPSSAFAYLQELLQLSGFSLNVDKTFSDGPFRESCGADFFQGTNIRPVFLKRPLSDVPSLLYLHNALWALEDRLDWTWGVSFENTRKLLTLYLPAFVRQQFYGPPSDSLDTYLFSDKPLPRTPYGYRLGFFIRPKARTFNRQTEFFFRKMMNQLKGPSSYENRWDKNRRLSSGNSFDVTKRDRVQFICTRRKVW